MASTRGILIIDRQGGIFPRMGDDALLLPVTAMAHWNNKLIVGCGSAAGTQGNLAYCDKTAYAETAAISGGAYGTDTAIASEMRTAMIDGGLPDIAKVLTAVTLVYYDNTAWDSMTMTLAYRMAKVTTSTTVAGGDSSTSSWTAIEGGTAGDPIVLDVQTGISYKTIGVGSDPGLAFQFRITANGFFEVVGIIPEFEYQTKRQQ